VPSACPVLHAVEALAIAPELSATLPLSDYGRASSSVCAILVSSASHLRGGAKAAASRWPIVTVQVILAFVASRFLCLATKSSDPPKQAA
jgi:hypothetical protein